MWRAGELPQLPEERQLAVVPLIPPFYLSRNVPRGELVYPEGMFGVVVPNAGDLEGDGGVGQQGPGADVLVLCQQSGVKLHPDQRHVDDVGAAGQDVDEEEEKKQTLHHNIDCFVCGENCERDQGTDQAVRIQNCWE